ncbi:hypothetical protein HN51_010479 [Arachis hypogaea]
MCSLQLWSPSHAPRACCSSVVESVEGRRFEKAARECYAVEQIWKLLTEIEELHLLMDPNDLMKLKKQIEIRCFGDTAAFCFWSKELVEVTKMRKEIKRMVSEILEVKVDPKEGPGIMEAAIRVYAEKKEIMVEVLQAMQGIEAVMKIEILLRSQAGCGGGDGECGGWQEPSWFRRLADRRGVGRGGEAKRT